MAPGRARVGARGGREARATRRTADANAWKFTARRDARGEDGARRERARSTRETRTRRRNDRERACGDFRWRGSVMGRDWWIFS